MITVNSLIHSEKLDFFLPNAYTHNVINRANELLGETPT